MRMMFLYQIALHLLRQVRFKVALIVRGKEESHKGLNLVTYDLEPKKRVNSPKYNLTIATLTLNPGTYIEEWLEFHLSQGVEHFYIYDQLSSDDTLQKLSGYIKSGKVTVIPWPNVFGIGTQILAFAHAISTYWRDSRWIALIDIDEFIFPNIKKTVTEALAELEEFSAIYLHWRCFGPSGHMKRPDGYVIRNFTHMAKVPKEFGSMRGDLTRIKAIIDPSRCTLVKVHGSKVQGEVLDSPIGLKLNHYITLSEEEFENKLNRGLVESPWGNKKNADSWAKKRVAQFKYISENYEINTDISKYDFLP